MKVLAEVAKQIVYEDHEEWEPVTDEKIEGQARWRTDWSRIFKHIPSGKHYYIYWHAGSTESQDGQEMFYDKEVKLTEMEQREVTEMKWVKVKDVS